MIVAKVVTTATYIGQRGKERLPYYTYRKKIYRTDGSLYMDLNGAKMAAGRSKTAIIFHVGFEREGGWVVAKPYRGVLPKVNTGRRLR